MVNYPSKVLKPDFSAVFNALPGFYLLLSPEMRVLAATEVALTSLGQKPEQLIGKKIQELIGEEGAGNRAFFSKLATLFASRAANSESQPAENKGSQPELTGSVQFRQQNWQVTVTSVHGAPGDHTFMLHFAGNSKNPPDMQNELLNTTDQFEFLADSIPQLIWTTDPKGSHEYFNRRWTEFTGYTQEESQGPDMWNNLLHPDDQGRARDVWNRSLKSGEPYEIEYRFKSAKDGQYYWFLGRAVPMRDSEGNIVKWFGTCTDISRKKKFEDELQEKNQELKMINDDLDSFVYMASHDLKLPIINISTLFEELLLNVKFGDAEAEVMVKLIRQSLKQVHETIDDLGEIVKVQKNVYAHEENIALEPLLKEVLDSIADLVTGADAQIEADFSQVPFLHFSRVNLKSILYNLLSNAVKFRSPNRRPQVKLKTIRTADGVQLEVSDNGLGLDLNKHGDKLFQMFKRFHNHVDGSGLGLHIISRIMHKSGGNIAVTSLPDQGTTFKLYFANHTKHHAGDQS